MKGWLLDTNVVASLTAPNGAPSVKRWAAATDERRFHISVLTLAEYDQGRSKLPEGDPLRLRYAQVRDELAVRFAGRVVSLSDAMVRRWGDTSGRIWRETRHRPPVINTLLAVIAMELELYLVTRNTRDVVRTGAVIFNPWTDDPGAFPVA